MQAAYFCLTLLFSHCVVIVNRFPEDPELEIYVVIQALLHLLHINYLEGPAVLVEPLSPFIVKMYPTCDNPMPISSSTLIDYLTTSGTQQECIDFPPCFN